MGKNKRKQARKGGNKKSKRGTPLGPANWTPNIMFRHRFRFQANAASSTVGNAVSTNNLLQLLVMLNDAGTSGTLLPIAIRLRSVEMWGPPASSLAPVTVSVLYPAGANSSISNPEVIHSDTSVGATVVAHVFSKPPPGSLASMWLSHDTANNVMKLNFPLNAIVDVVVDIQLPLALATSLAPVTITLAGTGDTLVTLCLDGAPSTGVLIPVSTNTAT